jgi:hypothetical protein
MSDVRVKTWPLAVIGSVLVHVSALTGVYLVPAGGAGAEQGRAGAGRALDSDTVPLYLLPDELPPDVASKLAADQEAAARNKPQDQPSETAPKPDLLVVVKPVPAPELDPIPVQLGAVDGPKIQTEAWLKFDSPLQHGARESPVEQPQQDLLAKPAPQGNPGAGGADGQTPTTPAAERPPLPAPPLAQQPTNDSASAPAATATPAKPTDPQTPAKVVAPTERPLIAEAKPTSNIPEGPKQLEVKAGNSGGESPKVVQAASEPKVLPVEATGPAPRTAADAATGVMAGAPAAPPTTAKSNPQAPGAPGVPGATKTVASDRDSDAASVKRAAVFRNGKVEAGEGLDIRTVRPEFSLTTKAIRQPHSPTLEIIFGKDGRAKRVRVLKSSGFPSEVDDPVVTALYNWRAKGRLLDQLPARPDATVALEITIILD